MAHYRLYFHDEHGRFVRAADAELRSDDEAFARALELEHAHAVEVWSGARRIALIQPPTR
jgi:hypothetical protein